MNVCNPETAFIFGQLLHEGIGFALFELIINNAIRVHPKALLNCDCDTVDVENKALADQRTRGHPSPKEFYIHKTDEGVATLAACVYPKHTISEQYEPDEENPMIGFRVCGRYMEQFFVQGLASEQAAVQGAVKIVQGTMGSENAKIIVLFVHTLDTAKDLNEVLEKNGSKCIEDGLKVNLLAELPSYVFLAEKFLGYFADLTTGSGDFTQPTLG